MNDLARMLYSPVGLKIGWCLVHSIWQGTIGAVVFALMRLGMRRFSSNARYVAGCAMLVALVALPLVTTLLMPAERDRLEATRFPTSAYSINGASRGFIGTAQSIGLPVTRSQSLPAITDQLERVFPWAVPLWAIGVLALSCRWMHGGWWVHRVRTVETGVASPELLVKLQQLCERLNIARPIALLKSALVEVPTVVGWLRPVILLPASALAGLSPEQMEAILAHELAHVQRYDYLVNAFQQLVETVMFYNPVIWWISRCIREERENCCDDVVVRVCGNRVVYARALVTLEEARGIPLLAFAATGGCLLLRVRRLLGLAPENRPPSRVEFGGITLVAVGCILILTAAWLFSAPLVYEAAALIRINPVAGAQTATDSRWQSETYYSYVLQTECFTVRSAAVLNQVALEPPGHDPNVRAPKDSLTKKLAALKQNLNVRAIPNTSVIEIRASNSEAMESARIANAVAAAYRNYRIDRFYDSRRKALDSLELRRKEQEARVRDAQAEVDRLRVQLKVPDVVVSENAPTVALSAETLRHLEGLRMENQAEYIKQRTLLEHLLNLNSGDRPQAILTVATQLGIQDSGLLASQLEALSKVEQQLVALKVDLGPEHSEVVKARAQEDDLKKRVADRTNAILRGLQAKLESLAEGLLSLSNAVVNARESDLQRTADCAPYFQAKRKLDEEVQRFNALLQSNLALESLNPPSELVEIVEEATAPSQASAPNRTQSAVLLTAGLLLSLVGALVTGVGRSNLAGAIAAKA